MKSTMHMTYKLAKRIVILVLGGSILLLGIIMVVVPGPALIVIPLGLAILGVEFAWARRWLRKIRWHISNQLAASRGESAEQHR